MGIKLEKLNENEYLFTNEFGNNIVIGLEYAKKIENIIKNQEEVKKIENEINECKNDIADFESKNLAIKIVDFISILFEFIFIVFSMILPNPILAILIITIINIVLKLARDIEFGSKNKRKLKKIELINHQKNLEQILIFYINLVNDLKNKLQDNDLVFNEDYSIDESFKDIETKELAKEKVLQKKL